MAVKGLAVHAGREPQKGRSAILELARKIVDIHSLTDYGRGLTFNVGTVKGGVVPNAVPDFAEAGIDIRCVSAGQIAEAKEKLEALAAKTYIDGTSTELSYTSTFLPMEQTPGNERLFRYVAEIYRELGLSEPSMECSGGGSDSAFSVAAGVPTVDQMGVKGEWNHSDREYAAADSIFERARVLAACILNIGRFGGSGNRNQSGELFKNRKGGQRKPPSFYRRSDRSLVVFASSSPLQHPEGAVHQGLHLVSPG